MRNLGAALVAVLVVAGTTVVVAGVSQASTPPVAFGPKTDLGTAVSPGAVALGDLNRDGVADMAVANTGWYGVELGSVSVYLADGSGGFGPRTDYTIGSEVVSVGIADVNGDTFNDVLATSNSGGYATVWRLLGDGSGAFGEAVSYQAGNLLMGSFDVADLNGDDVLDVTVADWSYNSVNVLLGTGTGGFGTWTDFQLAGENGPYLAPGAVALGDLNGDGLLDAVTADWADSVSVLLGGGDGGFGSAVHFAAGPRPRALVVIDLNDDAALDVVTANIDGDSVSVLLGNGDGTLQPATDFAAGARPRSVAAGDLDGDSVVDLVTAAFDGGGAVVLTGDGAGGFAAPVEVPTDSRASAVSAADLDADGAPDLAVTNARAGNPDSIGLDEPYPGPGSVSVLLNTTGMPPSAPTIGSATAGPGQATVSWSAPASQGGSPVTGYVVTPYVGYFPLVPVPFDSTATIRTMTGLANGTQYRFRVQAVNAMGTSGYSRITNPVTPALTPPSAPTILLNATAGSGVATISWTAPVSNGGSPITGYVVTAYVGYFPLVPVPFDSTATSRTISGLANGTQYRFRVQAVNAIGVSGYSKVTNVVTPTA